MNRRPLANYQEEVALFKTLLDERQRQTPFLLALDTYEQANIEVQYWVNYQLLPWVADAEPVRVVVTGQMVPELSSDWGYCCQHHHLKGVLEAEAWMPVIEALGIVVPSFDYVAGVCAAFNGRPDEIMQFIKTLPSKPKGQPQPSSIDAKQVRDCLVKGFNRDELNELCFELELEVGFVDLGGETRKAKIISLVQHVQRRGRLDELTTIGREFRPHLNW